MHFKPDKHSNNRWHTMQWCQSNGILSVIKFLGLPSYIHIPRKKKFFNKNWQKPCSTLTPKQNKYKCTLYLVACKIFYCLKIRSVKNILRYLQEQFLKYLRGDSLKTLFVRVKIQNVPNNFGLRQLKINENPELLGTM